MQHVLPEQGRRGIERSKAHRLLEILRHVADDNRNATKLWTRDRSICADESVPDPVEEYASFLRRDSESEDVGADLTRPKVQEADDFEAPVADDEQAKPVDQQKTTVSERGKETLDEQDTNGLIGKGVAPRDEWFVRQYEASGTDTYHKPAKVHHKWDTMRLAERAEICPDAPNKVTKSAVEQAIKRFINKRDRQE